MGLLDFLGGGEPAVKAGDRAPDFSLPDSGGRMVGLTDFRGRTTLFLAAEYIPPYDAVFFAHECVHLVHAAAIAGWAVYRR